MQNIFKCVDIFYALLLSMGERKKRRKEKKRKKREKRRKRKKEEREIQASFFRQSKTKFSNIKNR